MRIRRRTPCRFFAGVALSLLLQGCNAPLPIAPSGVVADGSLDGTGGVPESITFACPVPPSSPAIPSLADARTWATEVLDYLNQGGLVTALTESLAARPAALGASSTGIVTDLNADGFEDLAMTLLDTSGNGSPWGSLFIVMCEEDRYEIAYLSPPMEDQALPEIAAVRDINADQQVELLVTAQTCGAHTCFLELHILSWDSTRFSNLLEGRSDDLPNPVLDLEGPLPDGSWQVALTGTGISSAGAGPYRQRTRTWTWDDAAVRFTPGTDRLEPPRFRIHALHDADEAAEAGDSEAAFFGYRRVIEDGTLDDWIGGETSRRSLSAFAAFRQMWLHLVRHENEDAARSLEYLEASATNDSADLLELARITFEAFEQQGMDAACAAAQAFAAAHREGVLGPLDFGYANRTYSAPDLCLIPE